MGTYFYDKSFWPFLTSASPRESDFIIEVLRYYHVPAQVRPSHPMEWSIPLGVIAMESSLAFSILRITNLLTVPQFFAPILNGVVMMNLDAILDPLVAVNHPCNQITPIGRDEGFVLWHWCADDNMVNWFGVPLFNYAGWFAALMAFTVAIQLADRLTTSRSSGVWRISTTVFKSFLVFAIFTACLIVEYLFYESVKAVLHETVVIIPVSLVIVSGVVVWKARGRCRGDRRIEWVSVSPQLFVFTFCLAILALRGWGAMSLPYVLVWIITSTLGLTLLFSSFVTRRLSRCEI
jgi:hypothetical protein